MGRDPTADELAAALSMPSEIFDFVRKASRVESISLEGNYAGDIKELDHLVDVNINNATTSSPIEAGNVGLEALEMMEDVENLLKSALKPREREVLRLRFGLKDGQRRTLQVGPYFLPLLYLSKRSTDKEFGGYVFGACTFSPSLSLCNLQSFGLNRASMTSPASALWTRY
jgi:hypothetical protein